MFRCLGKFRYTILWTLLAGISIFAVSDDASARDIRKKKIGRVMANIAGQQLAVYTYHPGGCAEPSILLVFHGNGRGARSYLKSARTLANRACLIVYAPLFDRKRFPNWSYHRGGIIRKGRFLPEDKWTTELIDDLVEWARKQEGRPSAPSFLFGHSAGGQFLSRVAAYDLPENVKRIIIANPSTYVLPTLNEVAPYGYGGLPKVRAQRWMRSYLAAPITIFLGSRDTGRKDLTKTKQAVRQGKNRLDRGQRTFEAAKRIAAKRGWRFNWKLVYADDVGHSGRGMLTAKEMTRALGF